MFAQSKDSLEFYKKQHDVPVKYKLEHFNLKGKVKSFYITSSSKNENDGKLIHEFDENGNLIQIKNKYGIASKKYNYNKEGKLISFTTISKSTRNFEVKLSENGNIVQLLINNSERGISTILNEFNKNGLWTKQIHVEENSVLQENIYENDLKLCEVLIYSENQISSSTTFKYNFFNDFIQIQLRSKDIKSDNSSVSYVYTDYYGNEIYGFPFEQKKISKKLIKKVLSNFLLDENKNWVKNENMVQIVTYY